MGLARLSSWRRFSSRARQNCDVPSNRQSPLAHQRTQPHAPKLECELHRSNQAHAGARMVIAVDSGGLVAQLVINDRCVADTGKFLKVLARAVNVDIEEVTSIYATFAETEVIALLSEGCAKPVVLDGVHATVVKRIDGLVARVGQRDPIVMAGGLVRNVAITKYLEDAFNTTLIVPSHPQVASALGATLFALDDLRKKGINCRQQYRKVEVEIEQIAATGMMCMPACPQKAAPITFEIRKKTISAAN